MDRKYTYLAIISQVIGTDHCFKRVLNKGHYLIPAVLVWLFFFSYSRQFITPLLLSGVTIQVSFLLRRLRRRGEGERRRQETPQASLPPPPPRGLSGPFGSPHE